MSILEGVRAEAKPKVPKFVIKPKANFKESKPGTNHIDSEDRASCDDVDELMLQLIARGKRLPELVAQSGDEFVRTLSGNLVLRSLLEVSLYKLMADRRVGRGLKGLNKAILSEIETGLWTAFEREHSIFQLSQNYYRHRAALLADLSKEKHLMSSKISAI